MIKRRNVMSLVVDGQTPPRLKMAARPLFSPDGRRLAYAAARAERHVSVVLDDHPRVRGTEAYRVQVEI